MYFTSGTSHGSFGIWISRGRPPHMSRLTCFGVSDRTFEQLAPESKILRREKWIGVIGPPRLNAIRSHQVRQLPVAAIRRRKFPKRHRVVEEGGPLSIRLVSAPDTKSTTAGRFSLGGDPDSGKTKQQDFCHRNRTTHAQSCARRLGYRFGMHIGDQYFPKQSHVTLSHEK